MAEESQQFRIVYRGLTGKTAERLLKGTIFTNRGFTDVTVNFWNACEPLDDERKDTFHNLMAINLPADFHALYIKEQEMFILPRNLTLKVIGIAMFNDILIKGKNRDIQMFAMEVIK